MTTVDFRYVPLSMYDNCRFACYVPLFYACAMSPFLCMTTVDLRYVPLSMPMTTVDLRYVPLSMSYVPLSMSYVPLSMSLEIREKLATDPRARIPRIELMLAEARCGQHQRASAIARELMAGSPANSMIGFQSACGFALSAGAVRDRESPAILAVAGPAPAAADAALIRDYTDRAIDCLRRAKALGFSDVVGLETDPDIEPIRDDPAFRALLAEFPRPPARRP